MNLSLTIGTQRIALEVVGDLPIQPAIQPPVQPPQALPPSQEQRPTQSCDIDLLAHYILAKS